MDLELAGRVAVVAGASRGIGRQTALALAKEGCDVALIARDAVALDAAAAEIRALGRKALPLPLDVTDTASLDGAFARVTRELGAPTLLILSVAALYEPKKLQHVTDAEALDFLRTDVVSAAALCKRAIEPMMDARFGRIVALSSVAARSGVSGGTLYSAGKAALEGMVRGLALDYSRRGITANAVAVSFAETERLQQRIGATDGWREKLEQATASRRIPTAANIADVVTFLCSPRAQAITGAVVDATAGAHLNNLW
jgi:NAD(P)-dependent dehydrogenase (short-subunit alcohol dehydrogenase family)